MTPAAIILMVVTILLVWGGLVGSIMLLRAVPRSEKDEVIDESTDEETPHDTVV